jgi:hypothetical protein
VLVTLWTLNCFLQLQYVAGYFDEGLFARHWLLEKSLVPVTLIGFGDKLFIQYGTASLALLHSRGRASEFFGGFPPVSRSSALH